MEKTNLVSACQSEEALKKLGAENKLRKLKDSEIHTLSALCDIMRSEGCIISDFNDFYVGYTKNDINKEFDILRFGKNYILNIEMKNELQEKLVHAKVLKQLKQNYYFLKACGKNLLLYEYVDNLGFYTYCIQEDDIIAVDAIEVANSIRNQDVDVSVDPDNIFVPSMYLISPFNCTEKFMCNEYFLTEEQSDVQKDIIKLLNKSEMFIYNISADAGTGKTLLMYDTIKKIQNENKKALVIHCAQLNSGQKKLIKEYSWNIIPIKRVPTITSTVEEQIKEFDIIFVDEAHRIRVAQLSALIRAAKDLSKPIVFSYDIKQYLKTGENRDIYEFVERHYPDMTNKCKKLNTVFRVNKNLFSFISNLLHIGSNKNNLDYTGVSIDYFKYRDDLNEYICHLKEEGWKVVTFTTSRINLDPYDDLKKYSDITAHGVIGQEFSRVAFIMDSNFRYNGNGKLETRKSYYSARGMMYQIATRATDNLKILVLGNTKLYYNLLHIKNMSESRGELSIML